jgi:hypothetical protein
MGNFINLITSKKDDSTCSARPTRALKVFIAIKVNLKSRIQILFEAHDLLIWRK